MTLVSTNAIFAGMLKTELVEYLGDKAEKYCETSFLQKLDEDLNIINRHTNGEIIWIVITPEQLSYIGYKRDYKNAIEDYMNPIINHPEIYKKDINYKCIDKNDEEALKLHNIVKQKGNKKTYHVVTYKTYVKRLMAIQTEKANELREYLYALEVARTKYNNYLRNDDANINKNLIEAEKKKSLILSQKLLQIEEEKKIIQENAEKSQQEIKSMKKKRIEEILEKRIFDFPFTDHIYSAKEPMTDADVTKVGRTIDVYSRTISMNTSRIIPLELKSFDVPQGLSKNVEERLHLLLEPYKVIHEWFNLPEETINKIIKKETENLIEIYNLIKKECEEYNEKIKKDNSDEKLMDRREDFTSKKEKNIKKEFILQDSQISTALVIPQRKCIALFSSGVNKGKICGKNVHENSNYCCFHFSRKQSDLLKNKNLDPIIEAFEDLYEYTKDENDKIKYMDVVKEIRNHEIFKKLSCREKMSLLTKENLQTKLQTDENHFISKICINKEWFYSFFNGYKKKE